MIQSTLLIFSLLVFTPSPLLLASDTNQCASDINSCGGCTVSGSGSPANPESFLPCSVISFNTDDISLNSTEWVYSNTWLESEKYALQLPLTKSNNTNNLIPATTATGGCNALSLFSSPSMYATGTCAQISIDAPLSKSLNLYYGYGSGQDLPYDNSSLLWDSPVIVSTGDYHSSAIFHYEDPYVLVNNSKISTGTSGSVIRLNNAPSNVFPSYTSATDAAIYFSIHNKDGATIEQTKTSDLLGWDNWIIEMQNNHGSTDTYTDNSIAERQAIIDAAISINTNILNEGSLIPYHNVSGYVDVTGSRYLTFTQGKDFFLPTSDSGGYPSPPLFTATPIGYGAENLTLNLDGDFETGRAASPSLFDDTNNSDTTVNVNNPLISTQNASLINTGNGFTLNNYNAIECSNSSGSCIDSSLTSTSAGGKVTYNIRNNSVLITTSNTSGCMDPNAINYNVNACYDDGSCTQAVLGCMNPTASNYNSNANVSTFFGGAMDNNIGSGSYFFNNQYLIFDSYDNCLIKSCDVYAEDFKNITFELRNNNGNVIDDTTLSISPGKQKIILNFDVPIATNLQLGIANNNSGLYRNNTGSNYPYIIADMVNIKGSSASQPGYYYFFYNIEVNSKCLNTTGIQNTSKSDLKLEKVFNILGSESLKEKNKLLFYLYEDGTVKKRIIF